MTKNEINEGKGLSMTLQQSNERSKFTFYAPQSLTAVEEEQRSMAVWVSYEYHDVLEDHHLPHAVL